MGREVYELVDGYEHQVPVGRHERQVLVGRDELQVLVGRDGPQMHVVEAHRFTGRDERQLFVVEGRHRVQLGTALFGGRQSTQTLT